MEGIKKINNTFSLSLINFVFEILFEGIALNHEKTALQAEQLASFNMQVNFSKYVFGQPEYVSGQPEFAFRQPEYIFGQPEYVL